VVLLAHQSIYSRFDYIYDNQFERISYPRIRLLCDFILSLGLHAHFQVHPMHAWNVPITFGYGTNKYFLVRCDYILSLDLHARFQVQSKHALECSYYYWLTGRISIFWTSFYLFVCMRIFNPPCTLHDGFFDAPGSFFYFLRLRQ